MYFSNRILIKHLGRFCKFIVKTELLSSSSILLSEPSCILQNFPVTCWARGKPLSQENFLSPISSEFRIIHSFSKSSNHRWMLFHILKYSNRGILVSFSCFSLPSYEESLNFISNFLDNKSNFCKTLLCPSSMALSLEICHNHWSNWFKCLK